MATVRRSFTLDADRDAPVLTWLDAQGNASEAVRSALWAACEGRGGGNGGAATLSDVVRAIEGLGERLAGLQVLTTAAPVRGEEDPELAAALESLGV